MLFEVMLSCLYSTFPEIQFQSYSLFVERRAHLQEMARFGALFLVECSNLFALLVQGFRGYVRTIWPRNGAALDSSLPEERGVLQRFEDRPTLEVLREVDDCMCAIVKNDEKGMI